MAPTSSRSPILVLALLTLSAGLAGLLWAIPAAHPTALGIAVLLTGSGLLLLAISRRATRPRAPSSPDASSLETPPATRRGAPPEGRQGGGRAG